MEWAKAAREGEQVIWMPTKSSDARRRALSVLASPTASTDAVIKQSKELG